MIVYSALFGAYDDPPAASFALSCRHVLFTDSDVDAPGWEVVTVPVDGPPRLQSRSFKLRPHVHFPGQEALYQDANMTLLADPFLVHKALLGGSAVGMVRHSRGHTLANEFTAVGRHQLADPEPLAAQARRYKDLMSARIGEGGLLAVTPEAEPFMTAWWEEVARFTHRDQLALPWAAQASGINPNLYASRSGLVTLREHAKARVA